MTPVDALVRALDDEEDLDVPEPPPATRRAFQRKPKRAGGIAKQMDRVNRCLGECCAKDQPWRAELRQKENKLLAQRLGRKGGGQRGSLKDTEE